MAVKLTKKLKQEWSEALIHLTLVDQLHMGRRDDSGFHRRSAPHGKRGYQRHNKHKGRAEH